MKKTLYKPTIVFVFFCFALMSCTKAIDFNQSNELLLEPVVASNLIYFKANASEFFVNNTELVTVRDSVIIDLFRQVSTR